MRRAAGLLLLACATFGAALGHATVIDEPAVNDLAVTGAGFPQKLSNFRFFADGARQSPNTGVTPYALNTPLWSYGAEKLRFMTVASVQAARRDKMTIVPRDPALWTRPR